MRRMRYWRIGFLAIISSILDEKIFYEVLRLEPSEFISAVYRWDTWRESLKLINGFKAIYGVGAGQFSAYFEFPESMHNQYIQILFENGLIGLILFIVLIIYPICRLHKKLNALDSETVVIGLFLCWIYFIVLFIFFTASRLKTVRFSILFFVLMASIYKITLSDRKFGIYRKKWIQTEIILIQKLVNRLNKIYLIYFYKN